MPNETLEQKVNAQQEKKPVIDSVINETFDAIKTGANLGIAVGLPYGADKFMGGFGARTTAGALYLASDDKSSKSARKRSIVGTAFAAFAHYTLGPISALSAYAKAALVPLWSLGATGFYMSTDHAVENKSLRGLGKKFREHYWPVAKKALWWLTLPTYLTTFLPALWQVPSIAVQSYVFGKYIAPHKKEAEDEKDKTPYYVAAPTVLGKFVYNFGHTLVYSPLKALYEIGSGLAKKIPKPAPAVGPTPAPQPA